MSNGEPLGALNFSERPFELSEDQLKFGMSVEGQNRKSSMRADVFRFAPKSGHCATESACPVRADSVEKVFLGCRTKILRAADAFYARRR
jgi:hypothetical protein